MICVYCDGQGLRWIASSQINNAGVIKHELHINTCRPCKNTGQVTNMQSLGQLISIRKVGLGTRTGEEAIKHYNFLAEEFEKGKTKIDEFIYPRQSKSYGIKRI